MNTTENNIRSMYYNVYPSANKTWSLWCLSHTNIWTTLCVQHYLYYRTVSKVQSLQSWFYCCNTVLTTVKVKLLMTAYLFSSSEFMSPFLYNYSSLGVPSKSIFPCWWSLPLTWCFSYALPLIFFSLKMENVGECCKAHEFVHIRKQH